MALRRFAVTLVVLGLSGCFVLAQSPAPLSLKDSPERAARIATKEAQLRALGLPERPTKLGAAETSLQLTVSEDETVRSGFPDTNFHLAACAGGLFVGTEPPSYSGPGGPTRSYLKFGLSAIPSGHRVTSARLWVLLLCDPANEDREIGAYGAGDGWTESTITWNNAPAIAGGPCSSIAPPMGANAWFSFDVAALVAAEAQGDDVATVALREVVETGTASVKYFNDSDFMPIRSAYLDVRHAPCADAGPDQTVEQSSAAGAQVTLNGSASVAPYQPAAPTTYAAAVAAGAPVVPIVGEGGSWSFDGSHLYGVFGQLDFGLCAIGPQCVRYWDWWYSVASWGETYPGYYLVGGPVGGDRRPWAKDAAGWYTGYVDVYKDDLTPPSVVPWRVFVSPDGTSMTFVRLPGIDSHEWREGATLLGTGRVLTVSLPLGVHVITLTITNTAGVTATDEVVVTVQDTTPPTILPPVAVRLEQTTRNGTPNNLSPPTVTDICDAAPTLTSNAPAAFPLGTTVVTWGATDDSGNAATATQAVTVVDTTSPVISAPVAVHLEQTTRNGTPHNLSPPTVTDICDAAPTLTSNAPAVFPLGTTVVTWRATDGSGNSATAAQTVTVVDTAPPAMTFSQLATTISNNKKLVLCATVSGVSDICDATPTVGITVTATEAIDPPGSRNPDWQVVQKGGVREIWLRGERTHKNVARTYTINVAVSDDSGNTASAKGNVTVSR